MSQADTWPFSDIDENSPVQLSRRQLVQLAQCGLNGTSFSVLMILLADHDPHNGVVKVTQQEIAERTGVGRQAVNAALKALADNNLVTRLAKRRYQLAVAFYAPESVTSIAPSAIEYRATRLGPPSAGRPKLRMVSTE